MIISQKAINSVKIIYFTVFHVKAQKQKKDHPLSWYREQHKKIPVDKYKAKWSKTQTLHDAWGDTYTVHKNNYGPLGRPPSLRDNKREYNKPHNTLTVKGLMGKYSNDPAKMKEYLRTHPHSPYGLDRNGNPIKRGSSEAIVKRYAGKKAVKTPSKAQSKVPKGKRGAVKQPTKAQIKKMMDANREYVMAMAGTVVPTIKPRAKTKSTKKATAKKSTTAKKRVSRSRVPLGPTRATFDNIERIKMNEEMAYRAALAGYEDEMAMAELSYRDMRSVDADLIDRGAKDHRKTVMRLGNKNKVKFLKQMEVQEYRDRNYY